MEQPQKKVLIVGGGFGGIKAAQELASHSEFNVSLISDQPEFRYYPALYKSATGGSLLAASLPLSHIFDDLAVNVIIDQVVNLDKTNKLAIGASGRSYHFDVLILALGSVTNYFEISGLKKYSFGIKSLEEVKELRDHLHGELADPKQPDINCVIVGGGPTGVELAGALPGYVQSVLKRHRLSKPKIKISLIEAQSRLLPSLPKGLSKKVQKRLQRLGVVVKTSQEVQAETAEALMVDGHPIITHNVVWTAGVTSHPFLKKAGFSLSHNGKVIVNQFLQAGYNTYVIGDNADTPYSGLAQTAIHDGAYVAGNLKRIATGRRPLPYRPRRPVYIIPIGPYWAAVCWGGLKFWGILGWLLRRFADFMAYAGMETWWKASKRVLRARDQRTQCPLCEPE
ncbi:MAG: FAD-dependent oxidoreductase [Candidatus Saccharimonadales bacterium]